MRPEGIIGFIVCLLMSLINIPFIFMKGAKIPEINAMAAIICFGLAIANLIIGKE